MVLNYEKTITLETSGEHVLQVGDEVVVHTSYTHTYTHGEYTVTKIYRCKGDTQNWVYVSMKEDEMKNTVYAMSMNDIRHGDISTMDGHLRILRINGERVINGS